MTGFATAIRDACLRDRGRGGGPGDLLTSREGRALQRKVMRGVFGMLRKRL